jgi:hypothetical protein
MAAVSGPTGGASDKWEVSEERMPVMRLTSEQILALIMQGRIGFGS